MVVIDTSILIDHLRLDSQSSSMLEELVRAESGVLGVSMISIQELYQGRSTRDSLAEEKMLATLSGFKILDYSHEIAKLAGNLARDMDNATVHFADAAIAATAILNGASLFTLNVKDFASVPDLELYRAD